MKLTSQRKSALTAGLSLIVMALAAGFSFGFVYNELVDPEDAKATFDNLSLNTGLFAASVGSWILIFILDLIVSIALLRFFKPVHRVGSIITAGIRIIYSIVLAVAIFHLWKALELSVSATRPSELANNSVMGFLNQFELIWSNGLIIFGIHLIGLGLLVWRAELIHKIWGVLLLLAGVSYTFVHTGRLFPEFTSTVDLIEPYLVIPMTVGELGFAIWLIVRGGKQKSNQKS
ncbi:DUF4386 domain-containing protein [Halocola ammonii]